MSPEYQIAHWEWYYIALYFFVAGTAAGAYFIGSLEELFGAEDSREFSRPAYYLTLPLLLVVPIPLIADLGRPERFWHLFFYVKEGVPYINLQSPMSVGSWGLLAFSGFALLSFLDNLIEDKRITLAPLSAIRSRVPRKLYALFGSAAGFFVAGYTGVLLNVTAQPFWAATSPLMGPLFIVSGASTGAAAIALYMVRRKGYSRAALEKLERFDRVVMIAELLLLALMLALAGKYAVPLFRGTNMVLFWGGAVVAGIALPLSLHWKFRSTGISSEQVRIISILVLIGAALLRICLLQAGQV